MKLIISLLFFLIISCENIPEKKINLSTSGIIETTQTNEVKNSQLKIENNDKKRNKEKNILNKKIFYLIGDPYFIEGVKYIPEENYAYNEVGLATYYDKELHNKKTINNDLNKVTELLGRHKTLPLPSIVKITNLDNGLSLTIKIVDRHDDNISIVQVSRKVAQLLRFYKNKIAKVKLEILPDPSKQWKNVTISINDKDFNSTVESAPTEIVSISNLDEDIEDQNIKEIFEQPIELGLEEIENFQIFLHVNNFETYQEIKKIVTEIELTEKYTSENHGTFYKLIIGPIESNSANKLVSTFISKGYKENKIILK